MGMMDKWKNQMSKKEEAAINKAIENQKNNRRNYKEVPEGVYTVRVVLMEVGQSSWGDDQINIRFQIQEGEYKKQIIFYNGAFDSNRPNGTMDTADIIYNLLDKEIPLSDIVFILQGAEPSDSDGNARTSRERKKSLDNITEFIADAMENIEGYDYELDYQISYSQKTNPNTGKPYKNKYYTVSPIYDA